VTGLRDAASPVARSNEHVFYTGSALAVIVAVFVGFAPTYYLRGSFHPTPLPLLHQVHGLVFTSWILLFLAQTSLIAGRRVALHRRVGVAGAVLAALVVAVGLTIAVATGRRNFASGHVDALAFLAIPFGDMLVFGVLAFGGIYYRRKADVHKRLMFLATISILPAAFARWPLSLVANGPRAFFGTTDLFIVGALVHDFVSRRRLHPVTIWAGLFIVASQFLRLAVAVTSPWQTLARTILAAG
jgi:hypothetical protein